MYDAAVASGATVHFNARVDSIDFDAPSITLQGGTTIRTDLIIAADGTNSIVRQRMVPGTTREITDVYVFQANIPKAAMMQDSRTRKLYADPATNVYLGPNTWSFNSVAPNQEIYDMQLVIRDFAERGRDPHPERLLERLENLDMVGVLIDGWEPEYKSLLLGKATTFFKWRVTEAPMIESALAKSGKVILIGDAFHGIDPSAGFGTALSLEDGFTLALLVSHCASPARLPIYLDLFAGIMKERSRAIANYSRYMGMLLGLPDGKMQKARDLRMGAMDPNGTLGAKADVKAQFGTPEWQAYLDDYDCVEVVGEVLKHVRLGPGSVSSRL